MLTLELAEPMLFSSIGKGLEVVQAPSGILCRWSVGCWSAVGRIAEVRGSDGEAYAADADAFIQAGIPLIHLEGVQAAVEGICILRAGT